MRIVTDDRLFHITSPILALTTTQNLYPLCYYEGLVVFLKEISD